MKEARSLPPDTKQFTANGHTYTISQTISAEKYKEYERLNPAVTFGLTFQDIYNGLHKVFGLLNKQQFANAAVAVHNIMNGIKDIDNENRIHPALEMAALFIIRDDEDGTVYDPKFNQVKIGDWQTEGLDMMFFFGLSVNSIRGFKTTLAEYTRVNLAEISEEINRE